MAEVTEPMYLISESQLDRLEQLGTIECGDTEARDIGGIIRARGPFVAQQAPAVDRDRIFALLSDPETRKEIVERLSQPWSIDVLREIEHIRKEHDAALIAQEREKWERERPATPTFDEVAEEVRLTDSGFVKCNCIDDECDDCGKKSKALYTHLDPETREADAYRCPECAIKWNNEKRLESLHCGMMADFENNAAIAAQAREDVLKEVLGSFNSLDSYGEEEGYLLVSLLDVQNRIELIQERSLRSEVGK